MIIRAKFASTCPVCNMIIKEGEEIEWEPGKTAVHAECAKGGPAPQSAQTDNIDINEEFKRREKEKERALKGARFKKGDEVRYRDKKYTVVGITSSLPDNELLYQLSAIFTDKRMPGEPVVAEYQIEPWTEEEDTPQNDETPEVPEEENNDETPENHEEEQKEDHESLWLRCLGDIVDTDEVNGSMLVNGEILVYDRHRDITIRISNSETGLHIEHCNKGQPV